MYLLKLSWHSLWIVTLLNSQSIASTTEHFKLVGMFSVSSVESTTIREAYGVYPREAARLAVEHVREVGLLAEHNYQLQMLEFDTSCDQVGAIMTNLEFTRRQDFDPDIPYAFVGPVCSESAELLATITSQNLKAVQVSYGVSSPLLSDVETYSHFYRTVPDITAYVEPVTAFLEYFNWQVIGIVQADDVHYGLLTESLGNYFSTQNTDIKISTTLSIASHYLLEGRGLQNSVRIYLAMVDESMGADTLCAAYLSGLTGRKFVWILLGDYYDGWWLLLDDSKVQCTEDEMLEALQSVFIMSNTRRIPNESFYSITGQKESAFWDEFGRHLKHNTGLDFDESRAPRVLHSYDAVWAVSKALNITLTEGNFTSIVNEQELVASFSSDRALRLYQALNKNMKKLSFNGVAGKIEFSDKFNSPQQPATKIFQMQHGSVTPVGIYKNSSFDFTFFESKLTWPNGEPPRDRPTKILQVVELWIVIITLILTVVVIVYAIVILIVNIVYRKHKVIKASSPYINVLIIVGCIFALLAIPVVSVEHLDVNEIVPQSGYFFFCNSRSWLIHLAITLSFGSLFAKTWRVYLVFRNPWAKARPYKDHVLLVIVGVMVIIDIVLLSLSTWRVPLTLNTYLFPSSSEQFVINTYRICLTEGETLFEPNTEFLVWLVVHSGLKGLLFVFGIFLVIQTSKIKAKFFQDSRFIGICIFVTVTTIGIGIPASFGVLLALQEDLSYVFLTSTVIIITSFDLTTIFIPRFLLLRKYKHKVPTAVLAGLNPSFRSLKRKFSSSILLKSPKKRNCQEELLSASIIVLISPPLRSPSDNLSKSLNTDDTVTEWESAYEIK